MLLELIQEYCIAEIVGSSKQEGIGKEKGRMPGKTNVFFRNRLSKFNSEREGCRNEL